MIDLGSETLISFAQAAELVPGRGHKRINPATVWRWTKVGVQGPAGEPVRLESIRIGGRLATSKEALHRFIAATNGSSDAPPVAVRSPGQRTRASARAAQTLERAGI